MSNLGDDITEQILNEHFARFGKAAIAIKHNHFTGESRGFGFVTYNNSKSAQEAKEQMNFALVLNRELRVCFKTDLSKLPSDANLFVRNISKEISGKILHDKFIDFGDIFSCSIRYSLNNEHCGYGYIQYEEVESANLALEKMDKAELAGQAI